jgi:hypothetical protein
MGKRKKNKHAQHAAAKRLRETGNGPDGGASSDAIRNYDASRGYIDPFTGQRGAFPGLDKLGNEFYGPPSDGLDYLRMVR